MEASKWVQAASTSAPRCPINTSLPTCRQNKLSFPFFQTSPSSSTLRRDFVRSRPSKFRLFYCYQLNLSVVILLSVTTHEETNRVDLSYPRPVDKHPSSQIALPRLPFSATALFSLLHPSQTQTANHGASGEEQPKEGRLRSCQLPLPPSRLQTALSHRPLRHATHAIARHQPGSPPRAQNPQLRLR